MSGRNLLSTSMCGISECVSTDTDFRFCNRVEDRCENCSPATCDYQGCRAMPGCTGSVTPGPASDKSNSVGPQDNDPDLLVNTILPICVILFFLLLFAVLAWCYRRKLKVYGQIQKLALRNLPALPDADKSTLLRLTRKVNSPSHRIVFPNVPDAPEVLKPLLAHKDQVPAPAPHPISPFGVPSARCKCQSEGQMTGRRQSCPSITGTVTVCNPADTTACKLAL